MITALIVFLWIFFAYGILVGIGFFWRPKFPTVLFGVVLGRLRLENAEGSQVYIEGLFHLLIFRRPAHLFPAESPYWVTHVQYKSLAGFLLHFPGCFHLWTQLRKQRIEPNPNFINDPMHPVLTVPGSELCLPYTRLPGWRDSHEGYILTGGYFGTHWD